MKKPRVVLLSVPRYQLELIGPTMEKLITAPPGTKLPSSRLSRASISLPPRRVEIEVEPESPVEGSQAVLTCRTDSSSPGVSITWYRDNQTISEAAPVRTEEGQFGGVISTSRISTKVTEDHINSRYRCEASQPDTSHSVSNTSNIAVQCE